MDQAFADDPRTPIERLRRYRLWKIADAYGIPYQPGASKETMIQLLSANNVDVTKPMPNGEKIDWIPVPVQTENGGVVNQFYPHEPQAGGSSTGDVMRVVSEREERKKRKHEEEAERQLERENAELKRQVAESREQIGELLAAQQRMGQQFEDMMARFDGKPSDEPETPQETRKLEAVPTGRPEAERSSSKQDEGNAASSQEHTPETQGEAGQAPAPDKPAASEKQAADSVSGLRRAAALRKECKEAGIPIKKTDRIADLERKLDELRESASKETLDSAAGQSSDEGDPF